MSELIVSDQTNAQVQSFTDLEPITQVEQAGKIATILSDVVEKQKLYATIGGKKYALVEAWQTMGTFLGVLPREKEVVKIDDNIYEAKIELVNRSGIVVGSATHICGGDTEPMWKKRPDYARRSMAVTRATGKAYRNTFSWIMNMAGYEPTPREEMDHVAPVMYEGTKIHKSRLAEVLKNDHNVTNESHIDEIDSYLIEKNVPLTEVKNEVKSYIDSISIGG